MDHHEDKHTVLHMRRRIRIAVAVARVRRRSVAKPVPAGLSGLAAGAWCVATLLMERRGGDDD